MSIIRKKTKYSAIGVDYSSQKIRLVQLKESQGSVSLYKASCIDQNTSLTDAGKSHDREAIQDKLGALIHELKPIGRKAVLALPSHIISTIPIRFNLEENEEMDEVIIREAPNYLPFPLDQATLDYILLPSFDKQTQKSALLIAAKREDILFYLRTLAKLKLEVLAIEPRYCSLLRTIKWTKDQSIQNNQFIIYIEDEKTIILVLVEGQLLIMREIPWGTDLVKEKIKKSLRLQDRSVEKVLREYGLELDKKSQENTKKIAFLDAEEVHQVIYEVLNPVLTELCNEIQKVVSYFVSIVQKRVLDKAVLLGNASQINSLASYIQDKTGVNMETWDMSERAEIFTKTHPLFEVAFGLAIRDKKWLI